MTGFCQEELSAGFWLADFRRDIFDAAGLWVLASLWVVADLCFATVWRVFVGAWDFATLLAFAVLRRVSELRTITRRAEAFAVGAPVACVALFDCEFLTRPSILSILA